MNGEANFGATFTKRFDKFGDGVLSLSGAETVSGNNDNIFGILELFNSLKMDEH